MTEAVQTTKAMINEFLAALKRGIDGLTAAGQLLCKMEELDPNVREKLIDEHGLNGATLRTLERIGRGELLPEIGIAGGRMARLPIAEQKRIVAGPVDALVLKPDGKTDMLKVNVLKAPSEMYDQLLNGDHIRSLDEQRAYLVAKSNAKESKAETMPWRVIGRNAIEVTRGVRLVRSDLLSMMKALEG